MIRREDWPERLAAAIDAARELPFAWGEHDCLMFAANCVQAMTGEDPAVDFRKTYRTARGAAWTVARAGGMRVGADARLGERVLVLRAQRGDVVLVELDNERQAYGICVGATVACPCEAGGVAFISMERARCAWRV